MNQLEKVCIITLGCKVNKYESECMATSLIENGFDVVFDLEFADFYIINTCAVTAMSEKKSRQYIAKIRKINPKAKIIICGCASECNKEQFQKDENIVVFGTQQKSNIVDYIKNIPFENIDYTKVYEEFEKPFVNSTRAYLKIQDGCNNFCSYCIIPYLRGRSRSRNYEDIIKEAKELSKTHKEIVLIGIDISDYRINNELALGKVMQGLSDIPARIRISSFEERIITDDFLQILKSMPNFAPHFHLSLQSGDSEILKKMNRKYTREMYIEKCKLIKKYFPDANITTDIIVGFPGETDEQFENSVSLAKVVEFGKIHIFPYSSRRGTVASKYEDLSPEIKKKRVKILSNVGDKLSIKYRNKFLGKDFSVILEDEEDGYITGITANYIKVYMPISDKYKSGDLVNIRLKEIYKDGVLGEYV